MFHSLFHLVRPVRMKGYGVIILLITTIYSLCRTARKKGRKQNVLKQVLICLESNERQLQWCKSLGAVYKCQHFHESTNYTFWDPLLRKKRVHIQHFLSAKNPHENTKNQAKKLKCTEKNVDFQTPPPPRKCMVCTHENVDIMDGPLTNKRFGCCSNNPNEWH